MAGAAALFLVYQFAFGYGKPQRERQWAIQVYCIGTLVLLSEVSEGIPPAPLSEVGEPLRTFQY